MGLSQQSEILRGWKEIEDFLRLTRKTIIANGYPLHSHKGPRNRKRIYAIKRELLDFAARQDQPGGE